MTTSSTQFFIKLGNTEYQQDDIQNLLNEPYNFVSGLSFDKIKEIILLFENGEKYESEKCENEFKETMTKCFERMCTNLETVRSITMLINEYFYPKNEGGQYQNVYDSVFVALLYSCYFVSKKGNELFEKHKEFIKMFLLSARYSKLFESVTYGSVKEKNEFI